MGISDKYKKRYSGEESSTMSLMDYLAKVKKDPKTYAASASQRMLKAIGTPKLIDTRDHPQLRRVFGNKIIQNYDVFNEIYGLEGVVEKVISFYTHASQGLEEANQALCFRGPVGSAKSTMAEILKSLMELEPIYVLKGSPVNESPLGLFDTSDSKALGIPTSYLKGVPSPWALKRLVEYKGDLEQFEVEKVYPSRAYERAICKVEAGDPNTQDISVLTGKLDIRQIEHYPPSDTDAYSYSGGLCKGNRGMLEFVEMLKADSKVLLPLLTALQEHNYKPTEPIGAVPFDGLVVAHFNMSDWDSFLKTSKTYEALIDRMSIIDVPYNLRRDEEIKIFQKLIRNSDLSAAPCAPHTYKCLANFTVLSKLVVPENSSVISKMKVYNGDEVIGKDPKAKTIDEYTSARDTENEGFMGISTRVAYKLLASTFNLDHQDSAADPVQLFIVLNNYIRNSKFTEETEASYKGSLEWVENDFAKEVAKDIQYSFIDHLDEYLQNDFEHYLARAEAWTQQGDYRDSDTGLILDREELNDLLSEVEKPAGIANPKDFRNQVIQWVLRSRAANHAMPRWDAYEPIKRALEKTVFEKMDDLLPVLSTKGKKSKESEERYNSFASNMKKLGYNDTQVKRVVDWYVKKNKSE